MDQELIAMLAVCAFALFGAGYFIGSAERKSRPRRYEPTEDGRWPL